VKFSKRLAALALVSMIAALPAHAQFGSLSGALGGGGGSKAATGDPAKIEQDLKSIIETTSIAMAGFADALGMKEQAAKFNDNATCMKAGSCGMSDGVNVLTSLAPSVLSKADEMQSAGKKLDAEAGAKASKALLPAVKAFPLWKQVADGAQNIDRSAAMRFMGLVQAAPKVPGAAKGTIDVVHGGVKFLTFSGVDTSDLQREVTSSMKF